LNDENLHATKKITEGGKGLLLPSIGNQVMFAKENSPVQQQGSTMKSIYGVPPLSALVAPSEF